MRRSGTICAFLLTSVGLSYLAAENRSNHLGHQPGADELRKWEPAVLPNGAGLPTGGGTALQSETVYAQKCASCHGNRGEGRDPLGPQLVGGIGTLGSKNPVLTVGSYWPYSTSIWDYIHRAMPYPRPGTLTVDETYAVTAYILYLNGIVAKDQVIDQKTLPRVQMPNRNGFIADPRPDVHAKPNPIFAPIRSNALRGAH